MFIMKVSKIIPFRIYKRQENLLQDGCKANVLYAAVTFAETKKRIGMQTCKKKGCSASKKNSP